MTVRERAHRVPGAVFMVLWVLLSAAPPALAQGTPSKKFSRGVVNLLTAPLEVPKQARAYWIKGAEKTDHILVWIACGMVWGMVQTVKRTASGAWDVLSFPFERPKNYEPLLGPDLVFQEWPRNARSGR